MTPRALARPLSLLAVLLCGGALTAQSYQTSFSEVKFDRAKTPATFHHGAEVDSATGAVSMNIPLGPGIGSKAVSFRPVLAYRWSPQVTTQSFVYQDPNGGSNTQYTNSGIPSKASLHPGVFNLRIYNLPASPFSENYSVLGGPTGVFSDGWSNPRPAIDKAALLNSFGYSGYSVTPRPRRTTNAGGLPPETDVPDMIRATSTGGVVLGLSDAAHPERTSTEIVGLGSTTEYTFPSLLLMVEGDRGYEFEYEGPIEITKTMNQGDGQFVTFIVHEGRYRLSKIVSRFQESILFTYSGDSYQVSWKKNGTLLSPSISVQFQFQDPGNTEVQVSVAYSGISGTTTTPSSYSIQAGIAVVPINPDTITADPEAFSERLVPKRVTQVANNEFIQFDYAPGPAYPPGNSVPGAVGPSILRSLVYPTKTLTFDWGVYPYVRNKATQDFGGYQWDTLVAFMYGVTRVTETGSGQTRVTTHARAVPRLTADAAMNTWTAPWVSKAFNDTITYPDGSKATHTFVEPLDTSGGSESLDLQIRTIAHLKHLITKSEYFGPNATSPHTVQTFDEWSLRKVGNPDGLPQRGSLPYPTHTVGNHYAESFTVDERKSLWSNVGWGKVTKIYTMPGQATQTRVVDRTWEFVPSLWLGPRAVSETTTGQPRVDTVFGTSNNLVSSVTTNPGGSPSLKTQFGYDPGTPNLSSVAVSSLAGATGSINVSYTHDGLGFMNSITVAGAGGTLRQTNDGFGRPTSQTDLNGLQTTIEWDAAGRLTRIAPPSPEEDTTVAYDADFLGSTLTRGSQQTKHRYTPFGKLQTVQKPSGEVKTFAYDAGDRLTFESRWGSTTIGTRTEYADPLGRPTKVTDANNAVVTTSYSGASRTVAVDPAGLNLRTSFVRDAVGRLVGVTDALGQSTTYAYDDADRIKNVWQTGAAGTQVRSWSYNDLGWLTALTQPESGTTTYSDFTVFGKPKATSYAGRGVSTGYDGLGRVTSVGAADGSVSQAFTYDQGTLGKGKLSQSSDGGVTTKFTYTGLNGRLGSLETKIPPSPGAPAQSFTQSFGYNSYGFRISASLPDGSVLNYPFDDTTGRGTGVKQGNTPLASITSFNAEDLPLGLLYTQGLHTVFTYDDDNTRLHSMQHRKADTSNVDPASAWTYAYDGAGRMKGDGTDLFEYDELSRLKKATVKLPGSTGITTPVVQDFTYDAFGNQLSTATDAPMTLPNVASFNFAANHSAWLKNQLPNTLTNGASTGAVYSPQGNLTQIFKQPGDASKSLNLTYDALGRVTEMADSERGVVEKYTYTPEGLRTRIDTYMGGVLQSVKVKVYNDQRQLVSEYEAVAQ